MCHNGGFKLTVKGLDHAIRLGVVAHRAVSDYAKLVTQIIPKFGFELSASIHGDVGWGPKTSDPPAKEGIADHFGFNIH